MPSKLSTSNNRGSANTLKIKCLQNIEFSLLHKNELLSPTVIKNDNTLKKVTTHSKNVSDVILKEVTKRVDHVVFL
jgi:hypothetical protein